MNLVSNAKLFAIAAHGAVGQLRKYTNLPYVVHPIEVAEIVASVEHTEEMLAAAYLHDVLEDTAITAELLEVTFGREVAQMVVALTRSGANYADQLAEASAAAQTVKVADIISNASTVADYDPVYAAIYLAKKRMELLVLSKANPALYARALATVEAGLNKAKAAL